jgi:adenylate cyclase
VFAEVEGTAGGVAGPRHRWAGLRVTRRDLRLVSGLTLFVYVATHLLNHALGLVSIATAETGLRVAVRVWQSGAGTLILYNAAGVHVCLALLAIYEHRTLRMPPIELLRIALGLGMPTLLIGHAVSTRLAFEMYGHPPDYAHVVWMLWHTGRQGWQIALLVPGWLHGCLGLNLAFGRRRWYARLRPALFAVALLLPACAVLGFLSMVKEVSLLASDASWVAATVASATDAQALALGNVRDGLLVLYFGVIGAVFAGRLVRSFLEDRHGSLISVAYPNRSVRVPRGCSVLEASRIHRIPHLSMCGGRGRCSTCRIRVVEGKDSCPPPEESERGTLARLGVPDDVRLACQLRPQGDISVVPLLVAGGPTGVNALAAGTEHEVVVMLINLLWPSAGHDLLPHDLLYAFNRFAETVGGTSRAEGGVPIHSNGDRVVVVFGLERGAAEGSRQALRAATELDGRLQAVMTRLEGELGSRIGHAIQIHAGSAAVGMTGDREARSLTVVGSAMDVVQHMAASGPRAADSDDLRQRGRVAVSRDVFQTAGYTTDSLLWTELGLPNGARIQLTLLPRAST